MKKIISTLVVSVMVAALCVGCNKTETPDPGESQAKTPPPTTQPWKPETVKSTTDPDDHSGHDHGPGGHQH